MSQLPNLISYLAKDAERYITLLRVHPTKRYNYAKRGFFDLPVIEVKQHGPKCKQGESWLYFAVPATSSLDALEDKDRLYIGAQTQDRMFRGDGLDGNNYHHAEMRAGKGLDNPIAFMCSGEQIAIYRIRSDIIETLISTTPTLEALRILALQPRTPKKHLGWWYEQYALYSEPKLWRWNTAAADKSIAQIFKS